MERDTVDYNENMSQPAKTIIEAKKAKFLHYYRQTGLKHQSAKMAETSATVINNHMKRDPEFAKSVLEAEEHFVEEILAEAYRRGIEGIEEPLSYQGKLTGDVVRRRSDAILMKLLEAKVPGFSRKMEVDHQHTHRGGVLVVEAGLDDLEDWKRTFSPPAEGEALDAIDAEFTPLPLEVEGEPDKELTSEF